MPASLTCARAGFAVAWICGWFVCEALASEEDDETMGWPY